VSRQGSRAGGGSTDYTDDNDGGLSPSAVGASLLPDDAQDDGLSPDDETQPPIGGAADSTTRCSKRTTDNTTPAATEVYKVLVLGSQGVGKTTLVEQLMTSEYLANKDNSFPGKLHIRLPFLCLICDITVGPTVAASNKYTMKEIAFSPFDAQINYLRTP